MINALDMVRLFRQALSEKWGYVWGSSGQMWTAASQAAATNATTIEYGSRWIGHRVADCSGLFSWAAAQLGGYLPHGSNSIYRKYCTQTGDKPTVTLEPGMAVFKVRPGTKYADGKDWYHIGLYVGDGIVIEAKGTRQGVVTSRISEWAAWGRLKGVSYNGEVDPLVTKAGPAVVDVPNDGTVRVRSKPSTAGSVLTTLPEGHAVTVEAIEGEWAKVKIESSGYIMSKYLREV